MMTTRACLPPVTDPIPEHLLPYIVPQRPDFYMAMDHAAWRYIMKVSQPFFQAHAHPNYLEGLAKTGISTERIPLIEEMDTCLRHFGWRAVGVSGFIPPAVFMEFQSLGILPIACDMRKLENLSYTPAPDIVHEAAGHAPLIADPDYARYLRQYGEVSRKAIFSDKDVALYEAIRHLSEVKENPAATQADVQAAQSRFESVVASGHYVSEMACLARVFWWTVEYGLVGSLAEPKIYGAGLLSSVGESFQCFAPEVLKLPFTVDAVMTGYDITRPQPQLFVTPDFAALSEQLQAYANTMAFRRGGIEGLAKALMANATSTTVLDTALQISGTLAEALTDSQNRPAFLRFQGPCQLALDDRELPGHGPEYHAQGYSTPVGPIEGVSTPMAAWSLLEWQQLGVQFEASQLTSEGFLPPDGRFNGLAKEPVCLRYASGIVLEGTPTQWLRSAGQTLLVQFQQCRITWGDRLLYSPDWGAFDLACGEQVLSVFGGAADRASYLAKTDQLRPMLQQQKCNRTSHNQALDHLYQQVREKRPALLAASRVSSADEAFLTRIVQQLSDDHPSDWLLSLELLELVHGHLQRPAWYDELLATLQRRMETDTTDVASLIRRGLSVFLASAPESASGERVASATSVKGSL
ncbi:MAG: aromatic amino acid hydroxylase [Candidatus Melainabacteria bacterium]|nr:aromatic amino acid hydroxylase [Candidatus Melainabacteria bacterium]